jgi:hypothetical protein
MLQKIWKKLAPTHTIQRWKSYTFLVNIMNWKLVKFDVCNFTEWKEEPHSFS